MILSNKVWKRLTIHCFFCAIILAQSASGVYSESHNSGNSFQKFASLEAAGNDALTLEAVTGVQVPGLSNVALSGIELKKGSAGDSLSAQLKVLDTTGEIDVFHPKGFDTAVFAITLDDKLDFQKLIPGDALAGGSLLTPTMVIVPEGKTLQPNDPSIPAKLKANIAKVLADMLKSQPGVDSGPIGAGITLLAELDIQGSSDMAAPQFLNALNLPDGTTGLPLKGTISPAMFKPNASFTDKMDGTRLKLALPKLQIPALPNGTEISKALLNISDELPAGFARSQAPASGPVVSISASAGGDSAQNLFSFQGLSAKSMELAATYSNQAWAFGLKGTAELNDTELAYKVALAKGADQKGEYAVTLEAAGNDALTLEAVTGVQVPGLSNVALSGIELKKGSAGDSLSAQLKVLDTTGEIDVFHPKGFDTAVFAITLDDKLDFQKLIPGDALAGGSLLTPTMVIVPEGKTLQPNDPSIPAKLKANIAKVLADMLKSQPGVDSGPIGAGITLLAELDIQGSSDMAAPQFLNALNLPDGTTGLPLKGTISPAMFKPNASFTDKMDGTRLKLALPKLQIPALPNGTEISKALLNISDELPAGFARSQAPASGPVVSISASAGGDSAQNLFSFQGLSAKSMELAATYSNQAWAFGLKGTAELNDTELAYKVALAKGADQKGEYAVTLEAAGNDALTLEAVTGVQVPGLSNVALSGIELKKGSAGDSLSAQLKVLDTTGEIDVFHPKGFDTAVFAITLDDKLDFQKLIPGDALAGGSLLTPTMVIVPEGKTLQPNDPSIPAKLKANIAKVLADMLKSQPGVDSGPIGAGITLLAELDIQGSSDMAAPQFLNALNLPDGTTGLPLKGTISPAMFKPNASFTDKMDGTRLKLALPKLQIPALPNGTEISKALLNISDELPAGFARSQAPASGPVVSISASAGGDSAQNLFSFQGLSAKSMELAATYSNQAWAFGLKGTAELNDTELAYKVALAKGADQKGEYAVTLEAAGNDALTLEAVTGVQVPGLSNVALSGIELKKGSAGDSLSAQLKVLDTTGEIDVFHPKGFDTAVFAITLDDKLDFQKLIPGDALAGGSLLTPTMVIVPEGKTLQPNDPSIPAKLKANIAKVLADMLKSQPGVDSGPIGAGITLLAELDIQGSSDMAAPQFLNALNLPDGTTGLPLKGTISPAMFKPNASFTDKMDGTRLKLALPKLQIPALPNGTEISKALLNISDELPAGFARSQAPASGPVVSISASAGGDSAQNLFSFQGLSAKSMELAATYSNQAWAFGLKGTAELNDTELAYKVALAKGADQKGEYAVTLEAAGNDALTLEAVTGVQVPGLSNVALSGIELKKGSAGDSLSAQLKVLDTTGEIDVFHPKGFDTAVFAITLDDKLDFQKLIPGDALAGGSLLTPTMVIVPEGKTLQPNDPSIPAKLKANIAKVLADMLKSQPGVDSGPIGAGITLLAELDIQGSSDMAAPQFLNALNLPDGTTGLPLKGTISPAMFKPNASFTDKMDGTRLKLALPKLQIPALPNGTEISKALLNISDELPAGFARSQAPASGPVVSISASAGGDSAQNLFSFQGLSAKSMELAATYSNQAWAFGLKGTAELNDTELAYKVALAKGADQKGEYAVTLEAAGNDALTLEAVTGVQVPGLSNVALSGIELKKGSAGDSLSAQLKVLDTTGEIDVFHPKGFDTAVFAITLDDKLDFQKLIPGDALAGGSLLTPTMVIVPEGKTLQPNDPSIPAKLKANIAKVLADMLKSQPGVDSGPIGAGITLLAELDIQGSSDMAAPQFLNALNLPDGTTGLPLKGTISPAMFKPNASFTDKMDGTRLKLALPKLQIPALPNGTEISKALLNISDELPAGFARSQAPASGPVVSISASAGGDSAQNLFSFQGLSAKSMELAATYSNQAWAFGLKGTAELNDTELAYKVALAKGADQKGEYAVTLEAAGNDALTLEAVTGVQVPGLSNVALSGIELKKGSAGDSLSAQLKVLDTTGEIDVFHPKGFDTAVFAITLDDKLDFQKLIPGDALAGGSLLTPTMVIVPEGKTLQPNDPSIPAKLKANIAKVLADMLKSQPGVDSGPIGAGITLLAELDIQGSSDMAAPQFLNALNLPDGTTGLPLKGTISPAMFKPNASFTDKMDGTRLKLALPKLQIPALPNGTEISKALLNISDELPAGFARSQAPASGPVVSISASAGGDSAQNLFSFQGLSAKSMELAATYSNQAWAFGLKGTAELNDTELAYKVALAKGADQKGEYAVTLEAAGNDALTLEAVTGVQVPGLSNVALSGIELKKGSAGDSLSAQLKVLDTTGEIDVFHPKGFDTAVFAITLDDKLDFQKLIPGDALAGGSLLTPTMVIVPEGKTLQPNDPSIPAKLKANIAKVLADMLKSQPGVDSGPIGAGITLLAELDIQGSSDMAAPQFLNALNLPDGTTGLPLKGTISPAMFKPNASFTDKMDGTRLKLALPKLQIPALPNGTEISKALLNISDELPAGFARSQAPASGPVVSISASAGGDSAQNLFSFQGLSAKSMELAATYSNQAWAFGLKGTAELNDTELAYKVALAKGADQKGEYAVTLEAAGNDALTLEAVTGVQVPGLSNVALSGIELKKGSAGDSLSAQLKVLDTTGEIDVFHPKGFDTAVFAITLDDKLDFQKLIPGDALAGGSLLTPTMVIVPEGKTLQPNDPSIPAKLKANIAKVLADMLKSQPGVDSGPIGAGITLLAELDIQGSSDMAAPQFLNALNLPDGTTGLPLKGTISPAMFKPNASFTDKMDGTRLKLALPKLQIPALPNGTEISKALLNISDELPAGFARSQAPASGPVVSISASAGGDSAQNLFSFQGLSAKSMELAATYSNQAWAFGLKGTAELNDTELAYKVALAKGADQKGEYAVTLEAAGNDALTLEAVTGVQVPGLSNVALSGIELKKGSAGDSLSAQLKVLDTTGEIDVFHPKGFDTAVFAITLDDKLDFQKLIPGDALAGGSLLTPTMVIVPEGKTLQPNDPSIPAKLKANIAKVLADMLKSQPGVDSGPIGAGITLLAELDIQGSSDMAAPQFLNALNLPDGTTGLPLKGTISPAMFKPNASFTDKMDGTRLKLALPKLQIPALPNGTEISKALLNISDELPAGFARSQAPASGPVVSISASAGGDSAQNLFSFQGLSAKSMELAATYSNQAWAFGLKGTAELNDTELAYKVALAKGADQKGEYAVTLEAAGNDALTLEAVTGVQVPGLSNVALSGIELKKGSAGDSLSAQLKVLDTTGEIDVFHPKGFDTAVFAITLDDKLDFQKLIPGDALAGGSLLTPTMVIVPEGKTLQPNDPSIPAKLKANIAKVLADMLKSQPGVDSGPIGAGITLLAELDIQGSSDMAAPQFLNALNLPDGTTGLPLKGTISPAMFKPNASFTDKMDGTRLKLALPKLQIPALPNGTEISKALLNISDELPAGFARSQAPASGPVVSISASAGGDSAQNLFSFQGLSAKSMELAATYSNQAWAFGLKGTAELNDTELAYKVALAKGADQKGEYAVTLEAAGNDALTLEAVTGVQVPGLSNVALSGIELKKGSAGDSLSAQLKVLDTTGEIDVFHPKGFDTAVFAITLDDKLDFQKLIPGDALAGGSLLTPTMVIVPEGKTLQPNDPSIPAKLKANIAKVLADMLKSQPGVDSGPIGAGITLLAELDIQGSSDMAAPQFLNALNLPDGTTGLPLKGTISPAMFKPNASFTDKMDGTRLKLALPKLQIPALPNGTEISKALLNISDELPAGFARSQAPASGPVVSISASAGGDSAQNLFSFQGLSAKSMELAATYSNQAWAFGLKGTAELNDTELAYKVALAKGADQKGEYAVTLEAAGNDALTLEAVTGVQVPGLSNVALSGIELKKGSAGDSLSAQLKVLDTTGEIDVFHPKGFDTAVFAITLDDKLDFQKLIPGDALAGGSLLTPTMVIVPEGKTLQPNDPSIPAKLKANIAKVLADMLKSQPGVDSGPIGAGITLLAELDIQGSSDMAAPQFLNALNLPDGTTGLPLKGTISPAMFKPNASFTDKMDGTRLKLALPKLQIPALPNGTEISKALLNISDELPAGFARSQAPASGPVVSISASAGGDSAQNLFSFQGLSAKSMELAATYSNQAWAFGLKGTAELNDTELAYKVALAKGADQKGEYAVTLEAAGNDALTLEAVTGVQVPGLSNVALSGIELKKGSAGDSLSAQLKVLDTTGEIDVFHPKGFDTAVFAITLDDKLDFQKLIPGDALAGGSLLTPTMVIVPEGKTLQPNDPSIPAKLKANIAKVLADMLKSQPGVDSGPIGAGITLLAELDIQGSSDMAAPQFLNALNLPDGTTGLPLKGTISPAMFKPNASFTDKMDGTRLKLALPKLQIPALPNGTEISKALLNISDELPAGFARSQAPASGPVVSISASAGGDSAQNLFSFQGLSAKSMELAATYSNQAWAFGLKGTAELNDTELAYKVALAKGADQKGEYAVTLEAAGNDALTLEAVTGVQVPGLSNVALSGIELKKGSAGDSLSAQLKVLDTTGEIDVFHPKGFDTAVFAITLDDKLDFQKLIPGKSSPLTGVSITAPTIVLVPSGMELKPDDASIPQGIRDNIKTVLTDLSKSQPEVKDQAISAGITLLAELDIQGSSDMAALMKSAGRTETKLPIKGSLSARAFDTRASLKDRLSGVSLLSGLEAFSIPDTPVKVMKPIFTIGEKAPAALAALKLSDLPQSGPFVTIGGAIVLDAQKELKKKFEFDGLLLASRDESGQPIIQMHGRASEPDGIIGFGGLSVNTLDLNSSYSSKQWAFGLKGLAELHEKKSINYDINVEAVGNGFSYSAILTSSDTNGITAKDISGRSIPGLDVIELQKITVTQSLLDAQLTFAGTDAEIAAFHPKGSKDKAVLAFRAAQLDFQNLIPGKSSPLTGVSITAPTIVLVPSGMELKPDDASIPQGIRDNIKTVLTDLSKSQPEVKDQAISAGITLLAELDIQGSSDMAALMKSAGRTETKLPIKGSLSARAFDTRASLKDRLSGVSLLSGLEAFSIPDTPVKVMKPIFTIGEKAPAALAALKLSDLPQSGPFVTIGGAIVLDAQKELKKKFEFDGLLLASRDESGQPIIQMHGRASEPDGIIGFGGLSVNTLDLNSSYSSKQWAFGLKGLAELHEKKSINYDINVEAVGNGFSYSAILTSSDTNGITAKDISGRSIPGLDVIELQKITVTQSLLDAQLTFAGTDAEIAAFHPKGSKDKAVLAFRAAQLDFQNLIPGKSSPLTGVSITAPTIVLVPSGMELKPDDASIPQGIRDNIKTVLTDLSKSQPEVKDQAISAGITLLAELDIQGSSDMAALMKSAGRTETKLPIKGSLSARAFDTRASLKDRLSGVSLLSGLEAFSIPDTPVKVMKPIFTIGEKAPAALAALKLSDLPQSGPFVTIGGAIVLDAQKELKKKFEFDGLLLASRDESGQPIIQMHGRASEPDGIIGFGGLSVNTLDLNSSYSSKQWAFGLKGLAELHEKKSINYDINVEAVGNGFSYSAILTSSDTNGITAKDISGRSIPGLDVIELQKITVTQSLLDAQLTFAGTDAEIAAFHPEGYEDKAVLAFRAAQLDFQNLIPGKSSPLTGVSITAPTIVLVPSGMELKPDDASIPQGIRDNIKTVLTDLSKSQPEVKDQAISAGITLLAELDIQGSSDMAALMKSAGRTETKLPIKGSLSARAFDTLAPLKDRLSGVSLLSGLEAFSIPDTPVKVMKPIFTIGEKAPAALAALKLSDLPQSGPFVTIGGAIVLDAQKELKKKFEFDGLLLASRDESGQPIIQMHGRASEPDGIIGFGGLSVNTLDLNSSYSSKQWAFGLKGLAELHEKKSINYDINVEAVGNGFSYSAILTSSDTNGITAKDISGRSIPGLDVIELQKITVTQSLLDAQLTFAGTDAEIAAFHPEGYEDKAVLAFRAAQLDFQNLIPGKSSPLTGVSITAPTIVLVPSGMELKPDDASIPQGIRDNIKTVLTDLSKSQPEVKDQAISAGITLLAELDIQGSSDMAALMKSAGRTETKLPIKGSLSARAFDTLAPLKDRLSGTNLSLTLPDVTLPGLPANTLAVIESPVLKISDTPLETLSNLIEKPSAIVGPFVTIGGDLELQLSENTFSFNGFLSLYKDEEGNSSIALSGEADSPTGLFSFEHLSVERLELSSNFSENWSFELKGSAKLYEKLISFDMIYDSDAGYISTLQSDEGIFAGDIISRGVPGLDEVALTSVEVSGESLKADVTFRGKKAEFAAFHPSGYSDAVLAFTVNNEVLFSELIPMLANSEIEGASLVDFSVVSVPDNPEQTLNLNDTTFPSEVSNNIRTVLQDANKLEGFSFAAGINIFSEFKFGSSALSEVMNFTGGDPSKPLAISGVLSKNLFHKGDVDLLSGMKLSLPMPDISIQSLPDEFVFKNSEFIITDKSPSGDVGMWAGISAVLSGNLMGQDTSFQTEIGLSNSVISLKAESNIQLPAPFEFEWLSFKDPKIFIEHNSSGENEFHFSAMTVENLGESALEIFVDLESEAGSLSAGLIKIKDKVSFLSIPLLAELPHAEQFSFIELDISSEGLAGKTKMGSTTLEADAFLLNDDWVFAISNHAENEGIKFSSLISSLSDTDLSDWHLNDVALIFSQIAYSGRVSDLPQIAEDAFSHIYGSNNASFVAGINIAINFSPENAGDHSEGLRSIGVSEDIFLQGSLKNIFGESGFPEIQLLAKTNQTPDATDSKNKVPTQILTFPSEVSFVISLLEKDGLPEFQVGIEDHVTLEFSNGDFLDLFAKLRLQFEDDSTSIQISLGFHDEKGWHNPLGISGITIDDLLIDFGIDEIGNILLAFRGKMELGETIVDVKAETQLLAEAELAPSGVGFEAKINELNFIHLIALLEDMAGLPEENGIELPDGFPLPEFKEVDIKLVTPGMDDAGVGLGSAGVTFKGEMDLFNQKLGAVDIEVDSKGLKVFGEIADIDFEGLRLKDNLIDIYVGIEGFPKFEIDSNVELLGETEKATAKFEGGMMLMEATLAGDVSPWEVEFEFGFGVDIHNNGIPKVFFEGKVKEDFEKWMTQMVPQKIEGFFDILTKDFDQAHAAINKAEADVKSWDKQIQKERANALRQKAQAHAALETAQKKVKTINNSIRSNVNKRDRACPHWYNCNVVEAAYYEGVIVAEEVVKDSALLVLKAVEAANDNLPSELTDPKLGVLEAGQAVAMAALETANGVISISGTLVSWIKAGAVGLTKVLLTLNPIVINELVIRGDTGAIYNGHPVLLKLDFKIFDTEMGAEYFAFKFGLENMPFNLEQLAFVPLNMIDKLFEKHAPAGIKQLMAPVHLAIVNELTKAEDSAHKEFKKAGLSSNNPSKLRGKLFD